MGPNPTDRGKPGSRHPVLTDAAGVPVAVLLTRANDNDAPQLRVLLAAHRPIAGKRGRPRWRYERLAEVHEAFMSLACALICKRILHRFRASFS